MNSADEALAPGVIRVIRAEAFRAAARLQPYGLDHHDLRQEFAAQWLLRRHHHEPDRSSITTFASLLCRQRGSQLLERALAQKRGCLAAASSLSDSIQAGDDGEYIERVATVSRDQCEIRLGRQSRPDSDLLLLRLAVQGVLDSLPRDLLDLALRLCKGEAIPEAARRLGISRSTAYRRVERLRVIFGSAGLGEPDILSAREGAAA